MSPRWARLMSHALRLGVPPSEFWRLSVAEWRALAGPPPGARMGRDELAALMDAFPDRS